MWTVTLLLKPLIVTLHLLGGLSTLSVLAWLAMHDPSTGSSRSPLESHSALASSGSRSTHRLRTLAITSLAVLAVQITLGGWTSSNYAALACPDFPTCQNSYWPQMDAKDAFVLWRGLGIDYEGGVLDHPARVAIHFVHRLGAIVTALFLGFTAVLALRSGNRDVKTAGAFVVATLIAQLILGPVMVLQALPLSLATAHNGVAALLLLSLIRLLRVLLR
jgi:cytochrome c oxidase assembly protein subunit 15